MITGKIESIKNETLSEAEFPAESFTYTITVFVPSGYELVKLPVGHDVEVLVTPELFVYQQDSLFVSTAVKTIDTELVDIVSPSPGLFIVIVGVAVSIVTVLFPVVNEFPLQSKI